MNGLDTGRGSGLAHGLVSRFAGGMHETAITGVDMTVPQADDRPHVGSSGDPRRPIRVKLPDCKPTDMTADELAALQHEIRTFLLYRPPLRRPAGSRTRAADPRSTPPVSFRAGGSVRR